MSLWDAVRTCCGLSLLWSAIRDKSRELRNEKTEKEMIMPWARKKSVVHGIFYLLLQICILEREEEVTMRGKRKILWGTMTLLLVLALSTMTVFAADGAEEYVPDMYATFWSLIPPVVAIVLALITKEVYSSLFIGILIGGVFYSGFSLSGRSHMSSRTGS